MNTAYENDKKHSCITDLDNGIYNGWEVIPIMIIEDFWKHAETYDYVCPK